MADSPLSFTHQASQVLGSASRHKLHEMHIRKVNGGYIVKHDHKSMDGKHTHATIHVLPDTDALHGHLEEHMGEPNPGEGEEME